MGTANKNISSSLSAANKNIFYTLIYDHMGLFTFFLTLKTKQACAAF